MVPGTDGAKMSKSYGNAIPIFTKGKQLKKIVGSIATDSKDYTKEPLDPSTCKIFALYELFATEEEKAAMRDRYVNDRAFGYGHAKQALIAKIEERFGAATERYEALKAKPDEIYDVLREGARRARAIARETVEQAREAVGLGKVLV